MKAFSACARRAASKLEISSRSYAIAHARLLTGYTRATSRATTLGLAWNRKIDLPEPTENVIIGPGVS